MQSKEYILPNGKTAVFEYDVCGIGKITLECMDELMGMIADRPQRDQSMETAEPTKVYAVTEGEYSDYGICAMFSDRSKAIEYIECQARSCEQRYGYTRGPYYLEEYDLNQEKALGEIRMFRAQGPLVGGALIIKETDHIEYWGTRARDVIITDHDNPDKRAVEGQFYTIIFAKDEEHASKIAYDKRAKLATQILIDGYGARID